MLNEILISLRDNLAKKSKNPFFGTLAIVFFAKYWDLFYTLLFFDPGTTRVARIEIIHTSTPRVESSICHPKPRYGPFWP